MIKTERPIGGRGEREKAETFFFFFFFFFPSVSQLWKPEAYTHTHTRRLDGERPSQERKHSNVNFAFRKAEGDREGC